MRSISSNPSTPLALVSPRVIGYANLSLWIYHRVNKSDYTTTTGFQSSKKWRSVRTDSSASISPRKPASGRARTQCTKRSSGTVATLRRQSRQSWMNYSPIRAITTSFLIALPLMTPSIASLAGKTTLSATWLSLCCGQHSVITSMESLLRKTLQN